MAEGQQHRHEHRHTPASDPALRRSNRALTWALSLTFGYAVVELVAGLKLGSLALVSDAGHMFSDASALGLAWVAAWLAQRPPGARHTYGLARAEVVAAFVNGLALMLAVVLIAVEAIRRLLEPTPVQGLGVMIVALFGLLLNFGVALILSRSERTLNLRAALLHVIFDMVGSVAALAAGAVIYFTGWKPIDPILSLVIALLILFTTVRLLRDALHVLMEGVPPKLVLEEIGQALARIPNVSRVHDLHVWDISSGTIALSAHLELARLEAWPDTLERARGLLASRFGIKHVTLQPEPMRGAVSPAVVRVLPRR
jgi:cobalt-zinc-cadmium efflux system protein